MFKRNTNGWRDRSPSFRHDYDSDRLPTYFVMGLENNKIIPCNNEGHAVRRMLAENRRVGMENAKGFRPYIACLYTKDLFYCF